jgi:hypothetical protein
MDPTAARKHGAQQRQSEVAYNTPSLARGEDLRKVATIPAGAEDGMDLPDVTSSGHVLPRNARQALTLHALEQAKAAMEDARRRLDKVSIASRQFENTIQGGRSGVNVEGNRRAELAMEALVGYGSIPNQQFRDWLMNGAGRALPPGTAVTGKGVLPDYLDTIRSRLLDRIDLANPKAGWDNGAYQRDLNDDAEDVTRQQITATSSVAMGGPRTMKEPETDEPISPGLKQARAELSKNVQETEELVGLLLKLVKAGH